MNDGQLPLFARNYNFLHILFANPKAVKSFMGCECNNYDESDSEPEPEKIKSLSDICVGYIVKNDIEYTNETLSRPCIMLIQGPDKPLVEPYFNPIPEYDILPIMHYGRRSMGARPPTGGCDFVALLKLNLNRLDLVSLVPTPVSGKISRSKIRQEAKPLRALNLNRLDLYYSN